MITVYRFKQNKKIDLGITPPVGKFLFVLQRLLHFPPHVARLVRLENNKAAMIHKYFDQQRYRRKK